MPVLLCCRCHVIYLSEKANGKLGQTEVMDKVELNGRLLIGSAGALARILRRGHFIDNSWRWRTTGGRGRLRSQ